MRILLVEDEKMTRLSLAKTMGKQGDEVVACETGSEGLARLGRERYDLVITDLRLPGADGMEVLRAAKARDGECVVIMITAFASVQTAIEALKLGAYDYLTKPFAPEELLHMVAKVRRLRSVLSENIRLRKRIARIEDRVIVGNCPATRKLRETIQVVAARDCTVLIEGESGTGKELVARSLHSQSQRRREPFVPFNCAVIPETLMESELFGHEKGAFSGAVSCQIGYFERANHGSVFIDDIDDVPLNLQVKLLRLLQEREVQRVGGQKLLPMDIRVICATKVNLGKLVTMKRFREDLYYRLNIVPIRVPPLRERREDIPLLAEHFLEKHGADQDGRKRLAQFMDEMLAYDWVGNIRELENVVQRIIALPNLERLDLGRQDAGRTSFPDLSDRIASGRSIPYQETMERIDQELLVRALSRCEGNISQAAKFLDLPRSTLRSKMEKYGIAETDASTPSASGKPGSPG
jgi:DNA-binding NtrC family response regulator